MDMEVEDEAGVQTGPEGRQTPGPTESQLIPAPRSLQEEQQGKEPGHEEAQERVVQDGQEGQERAAGMTGKE
eukprot:scaffold84950_cov15-Tisochrysis_lutea.AAC.1